MSAHWALHSRFMPTFVLCSTRNLSTRRREETHHQARLLSTVIRGSSRVAPGCERDHIRHECSRTSPTRARWLVGGHGARERAGNSKRLPSTAGYGPTTLSHRPPTLNSPPQRAEQPPRVLQLGHRGRGASCRAYTGTPVRATRRVSTRFRRFGLLPVGPLDVHWVSASSVSESWLERYETGTSSSRACWILLLGGQRPR